MRKIDKTTVIIKASIPGHSSYDYREMALISLPLAPWDQPMSRMDAAYIAKRDNAMFRNKADQELAAGIEIDWSK